MKELRDLRCPRCGRLLGKTLDSNENLVELRCHHDKVLVQFEGNVSQVLPKPVDSLRAIG